MSTKFETEWNIGDRVHIDGCESITATIVAFKVRQPPLYFADLEWFNNGENKSGYFEIFRLSKANPK